MPNALIPWMIFLLFAVWVVWPRVGLVALWFASRDRRRRELTEDALKHVLSWERRGKAATLESLSGSMHASSKTVFDLSSEMQSKGLLRVVSDGFALTPKGEQLALQVVRAHRLWERYLSDDAGLPMEKLHEAAEKAEHGLSPEYLDELDAHLGHPQNDPHGDPIPTRDGKLAHLAAIGLTEWPSGEPALIVHMEDEPPIVFQQILAAGLRPGMVIRILDKNAERIVLSDGVNEHRLAPAVAASIQVSAAGPTHNRQRDEITLAALKRGLDAEVVEIDSSCRGFSRRRLMDLGLTPGAQVTVALDNTFGDPRAFRVRGTTIALREEQTRQIWVRPSTAGVKKSEAVA